MAEVTGSTAAPVEVNEERVNAAIEAGYMVKNEDGTYTVTQLGHLTNQVSFLSSILAQALTMHQLELAKWKIHEFLAEAAIKFEELQRGE
jgi:hypothetical protein